MSRSSDKTPAGDRRPALRAPQFRIGTLLVIVALICFGLAAWQGFLHLVAPRANGPATLAAILVAMVVFAHLAGGALGTRLRHHGDTLRGEDPLAPQVARRPIEIRHAPTTKLSRRTRLSWLLAIPVVLGALAGMWIGIKLLTGGDRLPWSNLIFGAGSFFVLGGLFGFWISSLLAVLGSAIAQMHREDRS